MMQDISLIHDTRYRMHDAGFSLIHDTGCFLDTGYFLDTGFRIHDA
jgi:hypothetical protein